MTTKTTEFYTTFEAEAERQSAGYLTGIRTKTWATVERQQLFPFTAEGFDAAVKFAESI